MERVSYPPTKAEMGVIQQNIERDAMRDAQVKELGIKAQQTWDEEQPEWFIKKFGN